MFQATMALGLHSELLLDIILAPVNTLYDFFFFNWKMGRGQQGQIEAPYLLFGFKIFYKISLAVQC